MTSSASAAREAMQSAIDAAADQADAIAATRAEAERLQGRLEAYHDARRRSEEELNAVRARAKSAVEATSARTEELNSAIVRARGLEDGLDDANRQHEESRRKLRAEANARAAAERRAWEAREQRDGLLNRLRAVSAEGLPAARAVESELEGLTATLRDLADEAEARVGEERRAELPAGGKVESALEELRRGRVEIEHVEERLMALLTEMRPSGPPDPADARPATALTREAARAYGRLPRAPRGGGRR